MLLVKENPHYTYADMCEWEETNEPCELIDGELVGLDFPTPRHQRIVRELILAISGFLKGKPCELYPAPFSVRLNPKEDGSDGTVLAPDISVVCDASKVDERGCRGAPDLVIEVLPPSTARYDRLVKLRKYQAAGVREYWIVDPDTKTVQVCILKDGLYVLSMYADTLMPVSVLPGCTVNLPEVFPE